MTDAGRSRPWLRVQVVRYALNALKHLASTQFAKRVVHTFHLIIEFVLLSATAEEVSVFRWSQKGFTLIAVDRQLLINKTVRARFVRCWRWALIFFLERI